MSIKEKIGQRIRLERTAKGLTRKALAELTDTLKVSRINNYERGERTPGPEEIKQLATALEVSPAFLMCLSDDKHGKLKKMPGLGVLIPILNYEQAIEPEVYIQQVKKEEYSEKVNLIPVSSSLSERLSENAFALEVKDESMAPEFKINDILIIEPTISPSPGDFVVVKSNSYDEVIIRKYKQLSVSKINHKFELIAHNSDWPNIQIDEDFEVKLIGIVMSLNRSIKY
ncbi:S24 family peptidase [Legionella pneumophila serogroup 1]|uniref:Phage repressor n=1 Tax=Legionella moravica TaxID=39962 RepID=A0A378JTT9_9GAMM|nr:S24 family peptidase [Legionella moravica]OJY14832.1 MAG: repressor [Legionella sp. 40-6]HAT7052194.1 helix-turn-helix domain-containing protein [Legionella pneumophila]KTD35485.1 phage repressor [Legionella moravica]STX62073.1 phage repressor [Legionella moravica]HAT7054446.1 helix-turn-helix domain-containing protein [Legionella pneumophila]